jgi:hypothetical protein
MLLSTVRKTIRVRFFLVAWEREWPGGLQLGAGQKTAVGCWWARFVKTPTKEAGCSHQVPSA